jgi:phosphoribosylpyrophosphate synthetase
MLGRSDQWVRVGGVLAYVTCSLDPREGEAQLNDFLEHHPNYEACAPTGLPEDLCGHLNQGNEFGESEVMNIIGDVSGRKCLLVDDIVDSAGTLCNAAAALMENGASSVSAYVTHGVLSGIATDRVNNSVMEKLLITDSIQPSDEVINSDKFSVITIAPLIGEAMLRTTEERSVSSLFD